MRARRPTSRRWCGRRRTRHAASARPAALPQLGYRSCPAAAANAALDAAAMVVGMVETRAALHEVEAMGAVDRLDLLLIGTNDPCAEWRHPGAVRSPLVAEARARTLAACRRHGRHVGIGGWPRSRI